MSSPPDASGTSTLLFPRPLPSSSGSPQPTRKAPPSPLAISSSSLSPHANHSSSYSTPTIRHSLESSRSDLTSVHSDVTSLHCSDFPTPPSALPPIPASPLTPKSLYFSTTPTTPRSQSPRSGFLPLQDPPRGTARSLLGSPRSLKGLLTGSRSAGQSQFAVQQDQLLSTPVPKEPRRSSSLEDVKHGYERSGDSVPVRYSQYAVQKDSKQVASPSHPVTPTSAGTLTNQDWASISRGPSPLQPPRPAYIRDDFTPRRHSRREQTTQSGSRSQSPVPQSPQPPRSPLPVPPPKRDSTRDSDRYSNIARKAGVTNMGIDISEEQLLSTDFITEMLKQPAAPSASSARFLRLPDSPRSIVSSDDSHGLGMHLNGETRLAPQRNSALDPPGLPISVSMTEPVRYDDMPSPWTPESTPPTGVDATDDQSSDFPMQSSLASSVFPKGGDRIYFDGPPSLPVSPLSPLPNSQSLPVPGHVWLGHRSPHPLVPSTPMSAQSFSESASPRGSHGFAQANPNHLSGWGRSAPSQSIASRLPIGPSPGSATAAARGERKVASPRIVSPRVRQHHYPRNSPEKPVTPPEQVPVTSTLQNVHSVSGLSSLPTDSYRQKQESTGAKEIEPPAEVELHEPRAAQLNIVSVLSHTSSTRTQRDSLTPSPMLESRPVSSEAVSGSMKRSSQSRAPSHHSYDSTFLSSDSLHEDLNSDLEGEVQTASRVVNTTNPLMERFAGNTTLPTVVGMATAVVVRSKSVDRRPADQTPQKHQVQGPGASSPTSGFDLETSASVLVRDPPYTDLPLDRRVDEKTAETHQHLDAHSPTSGFEPEMTAPPSPRYPPSVDSPPSHHTDIPESAKSLYFSEDVDHSQHPAYLPHDEVVGQGFTFWDVAQHRRSTTELSPVPKRISTNNAASMKSFVSYITAKSKASTVTSRVTKASHRSQQSTGSSRWAWWKKKPLPPLPPPSPLNNFSRGSDDQEGQQLTILKERIGGSSSIPELGQYQRSKVNLVGQGEPQGWNDITNEKVTDGESDTYASIDKSIGRIDMLGVDSLKVARRKPSRRQKAPKKNEEFTYNASVLNNVSDAKPSNRILRSFRPVVITKTRKWLCFSLIAIVILAIILGASLGSKMGHKNNNTSSSCSGNQTGVRCNLDATCSCPSSISGTCAAPLANGLNTLVPVASQLFVTNITSQGLAFVLWESQGTPTTPNCAFQADLVDVGSVLDGSLLPNRTQWAEAALLWNLFQTGDIDATRTLQTDIGNLPFGSLSSQDGIVSDPSGRFSVSSSGYIYNFANQTVNVLPLTFTTDGAPSSQQLSRVNSVAQGALDRMYSFASASSTQQQAALSRYWGSVLTLRPSDLSTFLTAFKSAPIYLPFDATSSPGGQAISDLLSSAINKTLSFPPAIGCYPGLSSSQIQRISAVETQAFGLPALNSTPSTFDSTCFASHPVYGVLDVFRTRLPFSDSRSGVAQQAGVLTSDAASRVVLHAGELLSALPAPNTTDLTAFDVKPREFGTISHLNHIVLAWLQAFPTTALAMEAVKFVLSSPTTPPPSTSPLFNATFLPIVEVSIFGNIFLSDISSFTSSFSTPSGSLFFGSSQAQTFRGWALQRPSSNITWSQSTFAPQIALEGSSTNSSFEAIWSPTGPTHSSTVQEVVNALGNAGLLSP